MKVLLTGHNGYIGAVMGPRLLAAGHDVESIDSMFFEDCVFGESAPALNSPRKDIRDVTEDDLKGFDAVIHLAALSNDPLSDLDPRLTYEINHEATIRLAKIAKEVGVSRFLYSSSCSMYGASAAGGDELTEEAPLTPITPYSESKVRSEEQLVELADADFSPVFLRNATAYGVSPKLRADVVLNNFVCWAFTTGEVRILSDGLAWRPIVHVEDISHAFEVLMTAPRNLVHNQAFNVGVPGENFRVRELADIVGETVPGCSVTYGEGGHDDRSYRVDFSKITNTIAEYQPNWTAAKGALQLYSAFKASGLTTGDFQGKRYVRLNQLSFLMESGRLDANLKWNN